jgi:hypothetical protein
MSRAISRKSWGVTSGKNGVKDLPQTCLAPTVEELACGKDVGDEWVIMRPWHMGKTGRGMWAK